MKAEESRCCRNAGMLQVGVLYCLPLMYLVNSVPISFFCELHSFCSIPGLDCFSELATWAWFHNRFGARGPQKVWHRQKEQKYHMYKKPEMGSFQGCKSQWKPTERRAWVGMVRVPGASLSSAPLSLHLLEIELVQGSSLPASSTRISGLFLEKLPKKDDWI